MSEPWVELIIIQILIPTIVIVGWMILALQIHRHSQPQHTRYEWAVEERAKLNWWQRIFAPPLPKR